MYPIILSMLTEEEKNMERKRDERIKKQRLVRKAGGADMNRFESETTQSKGHRGRRNEGEEIGTKDAFYDSFWSLPNINHQGRLSKMTDPYRKNPFSSTGILPFVL